MRWCAVKFSFFLFFCVSFVSCIVMMSGWVLCTIFFSSSILFLIPFMLIWSMTMFLSFGDCCLWVGGCYFVCGGELYCLCLVLLRFVWVYEWCILLFFLCAIQMNPVCVVIIKYLYSAKFTNKCALMRCLIKYIVIHCVHYILYIYIYTNTPTYIHTMMVVNIIFKILQLFD